MFVHIIIKMALWCKWLKGIYKISRLTKLGLQSLERAIFFSRSWNFCQNSVSVIIQIWVIRSKMAIIIKTLFQVLNSIFLQSLFLYSLSKHTFIHFSTAGTIFPQCVKILIFFAKCKGGERYILCRNIFDIFLP